MKSYTVYNAGMSKLYGYYNPYLSEDYRTAGMIKSTDRAAAIKALMDAQRQASIESEAQRRQLEWKRQHRQALLDKNRDVWNWETNERANAAKNKYMHDSAVSKQFWEDSVKHNNPAAAASFEQRRELSNAGIGSQYIDKIYDFSNRDDVDKMVVSPYQRDTLHKLMLQAVKAGVDPEMVGQLFSDKRYAYTNAQSWDELYNNQADQSELMTNIRKANPAQVQPSTPTQPQQSDQTQPAAPDQTQPVTTDQTQPTPAATQPEVPNLRDELDARARGVVTSEPTPEPTPEPIQGDINQEGTFSPEELAEAGATNVTPQTSPAPDTTSSAQPAPQPAPQTQVQSAQLPRQQSAAPTQQAKPYSIQHVRFANGHAGYRVNGKDTDFEGYIRASRHNDSLKLAGTPNKPHSLMAMQLQGGQMRYRVNGVDTDLAGYNKAKEYNANLKSQKSKTQPANVNPTAAPKTGTPKPVSISNK